MVDLAPQAAAFILLTQLASARASGRSPSAW
jgi:hypothetical protein